MRDIAADVELGIRAHLLDGFDQLLLPRLNKRLIGSGIHLAGDGVADANRVGSRFNLCPGKRDGCVEAEIHERRGEFRVVHQVHQERRHIPQVGGFCGRAFHPTEY